MNREILTKAIEKAEANGFDAIEHIDGEYCLCDEYSDPIAYTWIFNHDFAKALWGEKRSTVHGIPVGVKPTDAVAQRVKTVYHKGWQYHLQNMVVAEDPIQYLGENI